ncbi:MAG: hypothetical protein OXU62_08030 [Gammaproteobacteria bacterium]|nr:hypothetical protein [Gammaproteobacteria bacterium]
MCCRLKAPSGAAAWNAPTHTLREECYGQYRREWNLHTLNPALDACQHRYCHYRPHGGKRQNFQTPMAYYQSLAEAA